MDNISYHPKFFWPAPRRPDKGYRWVNGRLEPEPGATFCDHEPGVQKALFLTFAHMSATPESILDFANHYGLLGAGAIGPDGETVESWQRAIAWVKLLESLWEAARNSLAYVIQEHLQWGKDYVACSALPVLPGVLSGKPVLLDRRALQKAGVRRNNADLVARVFVAEALNAARAACAPDALFAEPDFKLRLIRYYRIQSLFGLIVTQLEQSNLFVPPTYGKCAACGRWFELEPGVNRADRITCSDACRQKLHRQRRAQALHLHAAGKAVEEIAAEIGSSPETIAKWIKSLSLHVHVAGRAVEEAEIKSLKSSKSRKRKES